MSDGVTQGGVDAGKEKHNIYMPWLVYSYTQTHRFISNCRKQLKTEKFQFSNTKLSAIVTLDK